MAHHAKNTARAQTRALVAALAISCLAPVAWAEGGRAGDETVIRSKPAATTSTPQRSTAPTPTRTTAQTTRTQAPAPTPAPATTQRRTPAAQPAGANAQTQARQTIQRAPRVIIETAPSGLPPEGETRFEPDELIVRFQFSSTNATRNQAIRGLGMSHRGVRTFVLPNVTAHLYQLPPGLSVREAITRLEASAAVVTAQPNYLYTVQQSSEAGKLPQFGNAKVDLSQAHTRTTGANTRIAVIDTAVDTAHAELINTQISAFDATNGALNVDAHGTSVAGILAANGKLTGVAPDAQIVSISAFSTDASGTSHGNTWTIMNALNIAHDQDVHILNMSFSGPRDPLFERAMTGASEANILPVAAAGNEGPEAATLYPAGYQTVLSVTAIDSDNRIYADANAGDHIDFAAPGVDLLVLGNNSGFRTQSGTSMATAYVSGIAALTLSANPGADSDFVRSMLANSALDLGEPGKDGLFGHGLPSAAAAINGLLN
ncbi:MAG: S8 family serine peptidase [Pseudomonadota bacterium]